MAYTVGSTQVIKDDTTTQLDTLTVQGDNYLEIAPLDTIPAVGTTNAFFSGGPDGFGNPQPGRGDIKKFSFSAQTLTDTTGNLSNIGIYYAHNGPANSETDGFIVGGDDHSGPPYGVVTTIQKYPFTISSGTATDVGDLNTGAASGSTVSSVTDAYFQGPLQYEKFPFAISSGTASLLIPDMAPYQGTPYPGVGGLLRSGGNTLSSGFWLQSGPAGNIYKFPFASETSLSDTGDLAVAGQRGANCQDNDNSFVIWAISSPTNPNDAAIEKFPFAISGGTAIDVGTLAPNSFGKRSSGGSSPTDGYEFGAPTSVGIAKFPFAISGGTGARIPGTIPEAEEYASVSSD
jgi:hypothetical protein